MPATAGATRRHHSQIYLLATVLAFALVLLPFWFWYDTWFGRPLSNQEIGEYLNDAGKPRHAQHALVQIGERLSRGDASVAVWYPKIVQLASSRSMELRQTAAWIMGQDIRHEPFRQPLLSLLHDSSPMVRRNAALSLAAFRDSAARPELHAMLEPYTVVAPAAGKAVFRLKPGEYANPGTLLARIGTTEVRSPVPGEVRAVLARDGADVAAGTPLAVVSPGEEHVWEGLRGLFLVGASNDLELVRHYVRGVPGMPPRIQRQAALTAQEIERRNGE
jgi:biotin carboxyl carrier protein